MQPDRNPSAFNARALTYDAGLRSYFQKIYNIMAFGLVLTGVVAFAVASSPAAMNLFFGNGIMRMIVIFAPFLFVMFGFSPTRTQTMSSQQLVLMFVAFASLIGLSFATIFLVYSNQSIARVFFVTAGMFAGVSIYGYTTRKDLTSLGSLLVMGVWGIVLASLLNMFLHSAPLQYALSLLGVVVFTGMIAWKTQYLKQVYSHNSSSEDTNKMAVIGALTLYLSFINLFTSLLQLMGNRR